MSEFYAHGKEGNADGYCWHPLETHLKETAYMAQIFAKSWNAGGWGYLAGLWHDIGKYSIEFQNYLRNSVEGGRQSFESIRVDHSTAGAKLANQKFNEKGIGKAIAYIIAGHHGGLPDGISSDSCLRSRLEKEIPSFECCPSEILRLKQLDFPFPIDSQRAATQFSMFIRMLFSCLVDADFLNTEKFMNAEKGKLRGGYRTLADLEKGFFSNLWKLQEKAELNQVNRLRHKTLKQCLEAAREEMGLFSLTVPTGGGKTLSSMAFAIRHALNHGLKRIIYVIPFTSIIEQNAQVFRAYLSEEDVVEHHINFEPSKDDLRSRLASENWDAPIIVTTNVQFFESLFASRTSRCRKLHNIAESVVILDEVQTLPAKFLLPCLETLKELTSVYRTSIVLCSATQPAIQKRPEFNMGLENVTEIVENPLELARSLQRCEISVIPKISDTNLAGRISACDRVLCIVNTRRHARRLYDEIKNSVGAFHLSALMCPVHRTQVLQTIGQYLKGGQNCRVISTQLIEAGVDIDFPVVYRSLAGIDSIAQAAGRCNREGLLDKGQVYIFMPEDGLPPGHFRQTAQAAESVISRYSDDILSLAAIEEYFRLYYWQKGEMLDEGNILFLLGQGLKEGDFPFKTIAEKFRFIKDNMKPVIIPFDDRARNLIRSIEYTEKSKSLLRQLQKYTVSVYGKEWNFLCNNGSVEVKTEMFPVLVDMDLYKPATGLNIDLFTQANPESLYL